jgi:hypothetical protein
MKVDYTNVYRIMLLIDKLRENIVEQGRLYQCVLQLDESVNTSFPIALIWRTLRLSVSTQAAVP